MSTLPQRNPRSRASTGGGTAVGTQDPPQGDLDDDPLVPWGRRVTTGGTLHGAVTRKETCRSSPQ